MRVKQQQCLCLLPHLISKLVLRGFWVKQHQKLPVSDWGPLNAAIIAASVPDTHTPTPNREKDRYSGRSTQSWVSVLVVRTQKEETIQYSDFCCEVNHIPLFLSLHSFHDVVTTKMQKPQQSVLVLSHSGYPGPLYERTQALYQHEARTLRLLSIPLK